MAGFGETPVDWEAWQRYINQPTRGAGGRFGAPSPGASGLVEPPKITVHMPPEYGGPPEVRGGGTTPPAPAATPLTKGESLRQIARGYSTGEQGAKLGRMGTGLLAATGAAMTLREYLKDNPEAWDKIKGIFSGPAGMRYDPYTMSYVPDGQAAISGAGGAPANIPSPAEQRAERDLQRGVAGDPRAEAIAGVGGAVGAPTSPGAPVVVPRAQISRQAAAPPAPAAAPSFMDMLAAQSAMRDRERQAYPQDYTPPALPTPSAPRREYEPGMRG